MSPANAPSSNAQTHSPVKWLPENTRGRDFVVGDIHGEIAKLRTKLVEFDFDGATDRLFSVGDLIDRGPQSLECLRLAREPWFFAVKANHEDMMRSYLSSATDLWMRNGGEWFQQEASAWSEIRELASLTSTFPYAYAVGDGEQRFHVVHAELSKSDESMIDPWSYDQADRALWSRKLHSQYRQFSRRPRFHDPAGVPMTFDEVKDLTHYLPIQAGLSLTFCGHTTVRRPGLWRSHYLLDTGCGYTPNAPLTLMPVDVGRQFFQACLKHWQPTSIPLYDY